MEAQQFQLFARMIGAIRTPLRTVTNFSMGCMFVRVAFDTDTMKIGTAMARIKFEFEFRY